MSVSATDDWNGQLTLRVYCDDDLTFEHGLNPYWDVNVTVNPVNDQPVWKKIADATISEDQTVMNYVKLTDYVSDVDNNVTDLLLSITSYTNPSRLKIQINQDKGLDIIPGLDFSGTSKVNLQADDGTAKTYQSFNITIGPLNDRPTVRINSIKEGDALEGTVSIGGLASDAENKLDSVEVSVNGSDWAKATGTTSWIYPLDTSALQNGPIKIEARAFDGELYSNISIINVTINNPVILDLPPILIITSHTNGTDVTGKFTIKGTASDPEGATIQSVEYSLGPGFGWQNATSSNDLADWEFELDTKGMVLGPLKVSMRAYDGTRFGYSDVNLVIALEASDDDVVVDDDDDDDDDIVPPDDDDTTDERSILDYWWLLLLIALVLIIIIIVIIVIIVARRKGKKDEPPPAQAPPQQPQPVPGPAPAYYAQPMDAGAMPPQMMMMGAQQPSPYGAVAFAPEQQPMQQLGGYPQQQMLMLPPGPAPPPPEPTPDAMGLEAPPPMEEPMLEPTGAPMPGTGPEPMPEPTPQGPAPTPAGQSSASEIDSLFGSIGEPTPAPAATVSPAMLENLQTACHNCGELMLVTITQRPMIIKCWKCGAEGMIE